MFKKSTTKHPSIGMTYETEFTMALYVKKKPIYDVAIAQPIGALYRNKFGI